jgi:formate dehydrogenase subunit gamma
MSPSQEPLAHSHHPAPEPAPFVRFSLRQRLEHGAMLVLFTGLSVTGFPQKFFGARWAGWVVEALGGVGHARFIHRIFGWAFSAMLVLHVATVLLDLWRRRSSLTMLPRRSDFTDAIVTLKYYLGLAKEPAKFDRYDYRQKFEYWGLVFGSLLMVATGIILFFPIQMASVVPGQVIAASKVAHSSEGLMAFLVVIVWHIYNAHLNPDVFPFDTSIFTGKISHERMEKEHPLELARHEGASPREPGGGA